MSYTVLARKWRPQNFQQLVGQEHVQRAIVNAIEQQRLHHAYLFTGTRGVGKTTIARIFSKCLNCETGITSTPCGSCSTCTEIDEGRFVDLLEIDAASRTKVEDTREILDNVQYRPSRGRYKVYLIDEVHMLSNSSFNALLKTLEEPPPHVVFLLATTDPQKLPVTVLSRCLQFHLKRMTEEHIANHLAHILGEESIPTEEGCLPIIARAADGSMRDALSLLDQAIAFGAGELKLPEVTDMLGAIDQGFVRDILSAMAVNDVDAVFAAIDRMAEFNPDYRKVLAEMLSCLHRIAVSQMANKPVSSELDELTQILSPNDVQLFYQIGGHARRDLPLSPDAREGFEMAVLRMMAFRPDLVGSSESKKKNSLSSNNSSNSLVKDDASNRLIREKSLKSDSLSETSDESALDTQTSVKLVDEQRLVDEKKVVDESTKKDAECSGAIDHKNELVGEQESFANRHSPQNSQSSANSSDRETQTLEKVSLTSAPVEQPSLSDSKTDVHLDDTNSEVTNAVVTDITKSSEQANSSILNSEVAHVQDSQLSPKPKVSKQWSTELLAQPEKWHEFIQDLQLTGALFQILNNSSVVRVDNHTIALKTRSSVEHFVTDSAYKKIQDEVSRSLKVDVKIEFDYVEELFNTPKEISEQNYLNYLNQVKESFLENQKVVSILNAFQANISQQDIELDKQLDVNN